MNLYVILIDGKKQQINGKSIHFVTNISDSYFSVFVYGNDKSDVVAVFNSRNPISLIDTIKQ